MASVSRERIESLSEGLLGNLLTPESEEYDEARQIQNGLIDKRPALIARCLGVADVVEAIRFARDHDLEISVRGGGHSIAGRSLTDGGLVIDLSWMRGVVVDPQARVARVQGGVLWRELDRETHVHGLATTGGVVSTTGVGGLTLGGGLGWLMGKYGLAADNLRAVQLVTAAGEVLTASADEHAELFWALRGGGGNFGVATSFEFQLHPVKDVFGGLVAHPLGEGKNVLRHCRDFAASMPEDAAIMPVLVHAPDGSGAPISAVLMCHLSPEIAEADLEPLLSFGSPAMKQVGPMPYPALNRILDAGFPKGGHYYWKSNFLKELSDEAIDELVDRYAAVPSQMSGIVIEHFSGAVTRVGVSDTAFPHREPGFNVIVASAWSEKGATDENVAWTRSTYEALAPYFVESRYVNYLSHDDEGSAVEAAYGRNFRRLAEVKRKYDPDNVFHLNHNIEPA